MISYNRLWETMEKRKISQYRLKNTEKVTAKVVKDTEDGDIILMHDEFKTSVEAAFRIIDNLTAKGYTFVTVDELMVD